MIICESCGNPTKKVYGTKKFGKELCQSCYRYYEEGGTIHPLPNEGEIVYSDRGFPICHVCGKDFRKVLSHVHQVHHLSEKEYKKKYGLDVTKGIISDTTKMKLRKAVSKHYKVVVSKNLLNAGIKTRFKVGGIGRTKDKVSKQTLFRLKRIKPTHSI